MAENDPPPFDSTTPAANDTGRGLLLVAALLLTTGVMWALGRGALVWVLVLVPPASLAWMLLMGRNTDLSNWLTENAFVVITVPLMGWLLGALLLWLLVNAVWAAEQTDVVSDNKLLTVAGATLTATVTAAVTTPAITLRDEPGALEFSFDGDAATLPDETLQATITLPSELAFAVAPGPETRQHFIPLNGTLAERRVAIVTNGEFDGLRAAAKKPITIQLCTPAGACQFLELAARVEGRQGLAIRRFVTSTVNQASPLLLLLLLATPGLAALMQRLVSEAQQDMRARREEEYSRLVQRLRDHLCVKDIKRAKEDWSKLQDERYGDYDRGDKEVAEALLQLARLTYRWPLNNGAELVARQEWPDARIIEMGPRWPREFVAAGIVAWRYFNQPEFKPGYCAGRPEVEPVFDTTILPALDAYVDRVWSAVMRIGLDKNDPLHGERTHTDGHRFAPHVLPFRRKVVQATPPEPYVITSRALVTPFAHDDAADPAEKKFLRDGQAFWGHGDALEQQLREPERSLIIQGLPGSGRTTLATILPHPYLSHPNDLYVRINADIRRQDIMVETARQLLDFILDQPIFLSRYEDAQKQAVGSFLVTWLAQQNVKADVARRVHALQEPKAGSESRLGSEQLKSFSERFLERPTMSAPPLDGTDWYTSLLACARNLEYHRVLFIVDVGRPQNDDHLDRLYALLDQKELPEHDIFTWLFVDDGFPVRKASIEPGRERPLRLTWSEEDLRDMVEWRFEKYLEAANLWTARKRRNALTRCFEDEQGLEQLLKLSQVHVPSTGQDEYSPGRFFHLWRCAARGKELDALITPADIERAVTENPS